VWWESCGVATDRSNRSGFASTRKRISSWSIASVAAKPLRGRSGRTHGIRSARPLHDSSRATPASVASEAPRLGLLCSLRGNHRCMTREEFSACGVVFRGAVFRISSVSSARGVIRLCVSPKRPIIPHTLLAAPFRAKFWIGPFRFAPESVRFTKRLHCVAEAQSFTTRACLTALFCVDRGDPILSSVFRASRCFRRCARSSARRQIVWRESERGL